MKNLHINETTLSPAFQSSVTKFNFILVSYFLKNMFITYRHILKMKHLQ